MARLIPKFDISKCLNCVSELSWKKGKSLAEYKKRKFCNAKCFANYNKDIICKNLSRKGPVGFIPVGAFKKGSIPWNKGIKWEAMMGVNNPSRRPEVRLKLSGENCHLWKGGISSLNVQIRGSLEYRLWREAVFKRDDYTCLECKQRGGKLNAHHIKPFSLFPELRFAIDNGATLCELCHKKTDSYAGKGLKREHYNKKNEVSL